MNRSGRPVAAFAAFYRIPRPAILVVHDDLDLPPGTARLKQDGGHGGHNGLRDLIPSLGGNDFLRLRIGIVITSYSIHYTKLYEISTGAVR